MWNIWCVWESAHFFSISLFLHPSLLNTRKTIRINGFTVYSCSNCFAMVSFQIAFPFPNISNTINDAILIRKENIVDKYRNAFTHKQAHMHTHVRTQCFVRLCLYIVLSFVFLLLSLEFREFRLYISFISIALCCCGRRTERKTIPPKWLYLWNQAKQNNDTLVYTHTQTHVHCKYTFATKRYSCTWKWYRCLSINW